MAQEQVESLRPIEWAVAARTHPGESRSGDAYVVKPHPGGVLVAMVDGLGHGGDAADVAARAADTLAAHAGDPLELLVTRCHERLRSTRGAAMTLVSLNSANDTMSWLGVGNVEALLRRGYHGRSRHRVVMRNGVVGYQIPRLQASTVPIRPGDLLILATDGIARRFAEGELPEGTPQVIADLLLDRFGKDTDDALVLVSRYIGDEP